MPKSFLTINYLIPAFVIILAFIVIYSLGSFGSGRAPDTVFTSITGKKIALQDLRGKPVVVTFWATDCPACIDEIPDWVELYRLYHERGLEMIAVSMYYDPPSHVVAMAKAKDLPYDVALDVTAEHAREFGNVNLTPTSFLISPQGRIIEHKIGKIDLEKMKTRIKELLLG